MDREGQDDHADQTPMNEDKFEVINELAGSIAFGRHRITRGRHHAGESPGMSEDRAECKPPKNSHIKRSQLMIADVGLNL